MSNAPSLGTVVYKSGFKNKIINGKMEIAQRGASFAAIANNAFSVDRWAYVNTSAAVQTASQQTDVPANNEFLNSLRFTVTTADASIAAGDVSIIDHRIEGYNARDLVGRAIALSFWVRSSKTGIHCAALRNGVADRSYVMEYTVNAANTWEKKTLSVPAGLITAGTWDWTTGIGLSVAFTMTAGSTLRTTAGAWQTGNFVATTNQVNCLDTIGNIFAITGVQLEVGLASEFEHRDYGSELAMCRRYYQVLGKDVNNEFNFYAFANAASVTVLSAVPLLGEMRGIPIVTRVGSWSGTNTSGQPTISTVSKQRFTISAIATVAGMVQFNNSTASTMHITADAELS